MKSINFLTKNIILPLSDFLTGQSVSKNLKFLNNSQNWNKEEIDNYQNIKLRELIKHAYKNVPFYREIFEDLRLKPEDINSKNDLFKLPVITKDILRKSKNKHLATNIKKKQLFFRSSSGSTGEPFQFFNTKHSESFLKAAYIRGWQWMGYNLGDSYVKVSMNPRSSIIKRMQDFANNSLYLSSKQLSKEEFNKIVNSIIKFDPQYIRCYPSPLEFLSKQFEEIFITYPCKSLIAINTTGSTLKENARKRIESVFGVKIFDSYSCEGSAIFFECPFGNYHPSEEYAIQEYLEDNYTFSNPEKPLRHITTDLHNYASPFIRYDTQDYVVEGSNELCKCGKHFKNITKIHGRDSDILLTPSGKYLIVENFVAYFEWLKEVEQIQVIQNEIDEIVINLLVNDLFTIETKDRIHEYWTKYIGNDVKLFIEVVDEIKLTPTGKRRTVIRNPKICIDV